MIKKNSHLLHILSCLFYEKKCFKYLQFSHTARNKNVLYKNLSTFIKEQVTAVLNAINTDVEKICKIKNIKFFNNLKN